MFSVGTLTAAMRLDSSGFNGLALGAWGAVQATGAGIAIGLAGIIRDLVSNLAMHGRLGPALVSHATGYGTVYYIEIVLLFASLVAIGPLVRHASQTEVTPSEDLGMARALT
jgi:BCD family chlorophyll transporter-like MFS transporter